MSAFIVSPEHCLMLAGFAASQHHRAGRVCVGDLIRPRAAKDLDLVGQIADVLYQENIRSVQARYPNAPANQLPGPIDRPDNLLDLGHSRHLYAFQTFEPVAIIKLCQGLEYQSCETDDWDQTTAAKLLQRIQSAAIGLLPGYEDAQWAIREQTGGAS